MFAREPDPPAGRPRERRARPGAAGPGARRGQWRRSEAEAVIRAHDGAAGPEPDGSAKRPLAASAAAASPAACAFRIRARPPWPSASRAAGRTRPSSEGDLRMTLAGRGTSCQPAVKGGRAPHAEKPAMTRLFPLGVVVLLAAALAAAPAAAQQTQSPVAGVSPPGSCQQALALTRFLSAPVDVVPAAPILFSLSRFEPQYVEFNLSRPQRTAMRAAGTAGGDPVLTVFDATGAVVVWNDDEPGSFDALIDTELAAGLYCVQVRALGDTPQTNVGVELTIATGEAAAGLVAGAADDGGGTGGEVDADLACSDPARTIAAGAALAPGMGRVALTGRVEVRRFSDVSVDVRQAVTVRIDVASGEFDTVLELFDGAGRFIDSNDDSPEGGTDSRLTLPLEPGRYCLRVTGFEGAGGAFELAITDQPDAGGGAGTGGGQMSAAPCGDPATTADAGPVGPGFGRLALPARVPPMSRQDWRLPVSLSGEVEFAAVSGELDTVLMLFDAAGNLIVENDDVSSSETNSRFTARLAPGSYCLRLEGFGGASGLAEVTLRDLSAGGGAGGGSGGGSGAGGTGGAATLPPAGSFAFEDVGVVMGTALANAPSADATKWVAFTLPEGDDVQVNAISLSGSFRLSLFTQDGTLVATASGTGSMASARITATLGAGIHFIGMTLDDPNVPNKLRTITISR
jgi:hypothetical protein